MSKFIIRIGDAEAGLEAIVEAESMDVLEQNALKSER